MSIYRLQHWHREKDRTFDKVIIIIRRYVEGTCYRITAYRCVSHAGLSAANLVTNRLIIQRLTLGVVVDPVEDLLVPEQAVFLLEDPVVLIGEVEET